MINSKQYTVLWKVDDIKISHVEKNVVTQALDILNDEYGKEAPITISRGRKHRYLYMEIYYTNRKQVQITIYDYVHNILNEKPLDMDGGATTPAANHLFSVDQKVQNSMRRMQKRFTSM